MTPRPTHSIDQIKDLLLAEIHGLAYFYAPAVSGSYEDRGRYFTLNPGRADKSVGSFYITLDGEKAGKWIDHATGQYGDVLDLIALSLNCTITEALLEARAQLGLSTADPAVIRKRETAAARAKENRKIAARAAADKAAKSAAMAHRTWLSASASIANTPVEFYLRDARGIDLRRLGRQPNAIRYLDKCFYRHMDPHTGEVIEGHYPAMVTIVNDHTAAAVACHRTYLGQKPDGGWCKADLPEAKKVLGDYAGAWINLWKGSGVNGRKPKPLTQCDAPTTVFIAEGIEDALSATILLPDARHIAAISLSNFAGLKLPKCVTEIVLIADQDEGEQARAQLNRAVATHQAAGRRVRMWQNKSGGKDLNDALRNYSETDNQGGAIR